MNSLYHWVGFVIVWANICIALIAACWATYTADRFSLHKWRVHTLSKQPDAQEEQQQPDFPEVQAEQL